MKGYNTILIEKQQKISALSSGKIDKYEFLTGKELLFSEQSRIIEQAKFQYWPLRKALKSKQKQ